MTKKNPSTIQEIREELVRLETLWKTAEKWQGEEEEKTNDK